jgi:hypothetical protein
MNRRTFLLSALSTLAVLPLAWPKKPALTDMRYNESAQSFTAAPNWSSKDYPGSSFHIRELDHGRVVREYDIIVDDDGKAHIR